MDLRELTDHVFQTIDSEIKEQDADAVMEPMVFAFRGDDVARLPVTPLFAAGSHGRTLVASSIKSIARTIGMDAYLICAESYILLEQKATNEQIEEVHNEGIADHPDRKECIMMTAGDATGTIIRVWIMNRGEDGRVVELSEHVMPEGVTMEGRFHDLLKQTVH